MKKQLFLFCCIVLYAPFTSAQSTYTMSRFFHVTGAAFDLGTTLKAEQNPNIIESNPILGRSLARQIALESTFTFLIDRMTHRLAQREDYSAWRTKGHPKRTATIMNFTIGAIHFAAGSWNIHVMRSAP